MNVLPIPIQRVIWKRVHELQFKTTLYALERLFEFRGPMHCGPKVCYDARVSNYHWYAKKTPVYKGDEDDVLVSDQQYVKDSVKMEIHMIRMIAIKTGFAYCPSNVNNLTTLTLYDHYKNNLPDGVSSTEEMSSQLYNLACQKFSEYEARLPRTLEQLSRRISDNEHVPQDTADYNFYVYDLYSWR